MSWPPISAHTLELLAGASALTSHARAGLPSHGTEATSAAAKSILRGSDIDGYTAANLWDGEEREGVNVNTLIKAG